MVGMRGALFAGEQTFYRQQLPARKSLPAPWQRLQLHDSFLMPASPTIHPGMV
jgi:hypothetical protein